MPKFKICVIKTEQYFTHEDIDADNDLEALNIARQRVMRMDREVAEGTREKVYWTLDGKAAYRAEVAK